MMGTIGIVSGYFNPVHEGHLEYINAAKQRCGYLIVIVNNDKQVKIKGSVPFMDEIHRYKIMSNLKPVDEVVISIDEDKTVCKTLQKISNRFDRALFIVKFFNSGDRTDNYNSEEKLLCEKEDIDYVIIDIPKINSSSELIRKAAYEV